MLDPQALFVLDNLLRKYHTLPLVGAHGFLTAAASAPVKRDMATLMPFLFGGTLPVFTDSDRGNLDNLLSVLYGSLQADLKNDLNGFTPLAFLKAADDTDPDVRAKALQLWCTGYLHGARLDAEYWRLDEHMDMAMHFSPFIILAADESVEGFQADMKVKAQESLIDSIQTLYRFIAPGTDPSASQ